MIDYSDYDGVGLSDLIKKRSLSSTEVVKAAIDKIERLNPHLNAVIFKHYDYALKLAEKLDSSFDKGSGPLFGIPFLLKNLTTDCEGLLFSDGSKAVHGHVSDVDSELVKRLKRAGLVILGRTNASEFGVMPTTEPAFYGPTLNPWDRRYTPGGSSGGSAAAVASGMVPLAHGNDGGGSLRIPASCCGLFTMKPGRALNPLGPIFGDFAGGIVCEHGLSRTVRDSAALLDVTSGPSAGDPYYAPYFQGKYLEEAGLVPERLKIGFLTEVPDGWNDERSLHPDCLEAVKDAAELCENLGNDVEAVRSSELSWAGIPQSFLTVFSCLVGHGVKYWERTLKKSISIDELEAATWDLYQLGLKTSGADYLAAWENLQLFSRKVALWYEKGDWDLLLSPVMRVPPAEIGAFDTDPSDPDRWILNALSFVAFTRTQNITGQPAVSVPLYWNEKGLPIGIQFAGRSGSEGTLFRFAAELEKARPWKDKRPNLGGGEDDV